MTIDPYFLRTEVSHSDLCALERLLYGGYESDPTIAFANGSLLDAISTESHRVDYFNRKLIDSDYKYSVGEFETAKKMHKSLLKDPFWQQVIKHATFQNVVVKEDFEIEYGGFRFSLAARCKWDYLFPLIFKMGGDIKSTAAETQEQFEAACNYFDYFRSRAWYMDITGTDKDMLIGVSKKNFKVFKINIDRNAPIGTKSRDLYEMGRDQYSEIAFKWWLLMEDLKITA